MNQSFEIPFRLPGLNEVIETNRRNHYAGAKLKRETDEKIQWVIRAAGLKPVDFPCIVHMTFEEPNRRRDADNVESARKFVLDALVKSKVLKGDSPRWVVGCPTFTRYTGSVSKVHVTLIEDEDVGELCERLLQASEMVTRQK